jgi:hypothetical protein
MKKELRKSVVEKEELVFIADDGEEFRTEASCLWHENELTFRTKFPKKQVCDGNEGVFYDIYKINSKQDYNIMMSFYKTKHYDMMLCPSCNEFTNKIDATNFPVIIAVHEDDSGDYSYAYMYVLESLIKESEESVKSSIKFNEDLVSLL